MSDTLLPCPFCKAQNAVIRLTGRIWWVVECQQCFASGPTAGDVATAIRKWNERKPPIVDGERRL